MYIYKLNVADFGQFLSFLAVILSVRAAGRQPMQHSSACRWIKYLDFFASGFDARKIKVLPTSKLPPTYTAVYFWRAAIASYLSSLSALILSTTFAACSVRKCFAHVANPDVIRGQLQHMTSYDTCSANTHQK